jgi:hypothetical protein
VPCISVEVQWLKQCNGSAGRLMLLTVRVGSEQPAAVRTNGRGFFQHADAEVLLLQLAQLRVRAVCQGKPLLCSVLHAQAPTGSQLRGTSLSANHTLCAALLSYVDQCADDWATSRRIGR